jgi:hypothetical protein
MPSFQNPDGSFFNETFGGPILFVQDPDAVVKMRQEDRYLFVNASLLASLTVWLPGGAQPGEKVELCFETGVTVLSLRDSAGEVIASAPVSVAGPGAAITMRFISKDYGWFFWSGGASGGSSSGGAGGITWQGAPVTWQGEPITGL